MQFPEDVDKPTPDQSFARADAGYELPDGTRARFAFNHLALCQTLGVNFREIRKAGSEIPKYLDYDDDMQTVLHVSTLGPDELILARVSPADAMRGAASFFDDRGVRFQSTEYEAYEQVFRTMIADALFAEAEPETEDGNEPVGETEDGGEGVENFLGTTNTGSPELPSTSPMSDESGQDSPTGTS